MVTHRLIGIGTTNSNGVAHLTHDADGQQLATMGYKGKGNGKVDIVASPDNMISNGSDVSVPITVCDCTFYDDGTTGTPNPKWWYNNSGASFNSNSNGLTIASSSSANVYLAPNPTSISNPTFDALTIWDNLCVEFTVTGRTGNSGAGSSDTSFQLRGFNGQSGILYITQNMIGSQFKITYQNGSMGIEIDGVAQTPKSITGNVMVRFYIAEGEKSLTFKNFKFYPI